MLHRNSNIQRLETRVSSYLIRNFVKNDVFVKAMPHGGFRDSYIFDSVYIAYFLANVLLFKDINSFFASDLVDTHPIKHLPVGTIVRTKNFFCFVSSEGCNIPENESDFSGYRYTGLSPMKIWDQGKTHENLLAVNRTHITAADLQIPLLPIHESKVGRYLPMIFSSLIVRQNEHLCSLKGKAMFCLTLTHPTLRKVLQRLSRLFIGLRSWLWGGIPAVWSRKCVRRTINIDPVAGTIIITDDLGEGKYYYLLPKDWYFQARNIDVIDYDYYDYNNKLRKVVVKNKIQIMNIGNG